MDNVLLGIAIGVVLTLFVLFIVWPRLLDKFGGGRERLE